MSFLINRIQASRIEPSRIPNPHRRFRSEDNLLVKIRRPDYQISLRLKQRTQHFMRNKIRKTFRYRRSRWYIEDLEL